MARFIYALGIRHVGEETAEVIAEALPPLKSHKVELKKEQKKNQLSLFGGESAESNATIEAIQISELYSALKNLTPEQMNEIEGIGEKVGEAFYDWVHTKKTAALFHKLEKAGVKLTAAAKTHSQKLKGLIFVITGTLPSLSRDAAKDLIKSNGGKVSAAVSKNTSFVVAGSEPGSKYDDAQKLGVKIIDEHALKKMVEKK